MCEGEWFSHHKKTCLPELGLMVHPNTHWTLNTLPQAKLHLWGFLTALIYGSQIPIWAQYFIVPFFSIMSSNYNFVIVMSSSIFFNCNTLSKNIDTLQLPYLSTIVPTIQFGIPRLCSAHKGSASGIIVNGISV